uniref:Uncharacterized protein n=1 Tax=Candidatus Kentrum sp. FM TaxID=2126340 RepID=A0A450SVW9_9GAMM|nr:MAG: hypothetical protein BECKFM1743A_GA0114220_100094 [Candidatus Kentron sp. FM]VFJ58163.1 MAG: hypothetical protein BECKFM1743C_GA0114222_102171 [Candidatus Kentron sp. FM]
MTPSRKYLHGVATFDTARQEPRSPETIPWDSCSWPGLGQIALWFTPPDKRTKLWIAYPSFIDYTSSNPIFWPSSLHNRILSGNDPIGLSDQSNAAHPAEFPIMRGICKSRTCFITRRKLTRKRSLYGINEHFEAVFNAVGSARQLLHTAHEYRYLKVTPQVETFGRHGSSYSLESSKMQV